MCTASSLAYVQGPEYFFPLCLQRNSSKPQYPGLPNDRRAQELRKRIIILTVSWLRYGILQFGYLVLQKSD